MTITKEHISDQQVNAYVDGELSAHAAAALVRQMARDPEMAERVATLTRLKSEMRDLPLPPGLSAPDLSALLEADKPATTRRRDGPTRPWWHIRWGKISGIVTVMVMVLAVALTGLWAYGLRSGNIANPARENLVEAAVAHHLEWMQGPAAIGQSGPELTLATFARTHQRVYLPDLGASGLQIIRSAAFAKDGVQVGYVGVHDCRLSLFILPDANPSQTPLRELRSDTARVFSWRTNGLDYLLIAAGMDPSRLDLISKAVFDATGNLQPFNPTTQLALNLNHRNTPSCVAG